ncbi:hypothetical protein [Streptomyces sp. SID3343]|uniref:hypothetical protein n=1 Tax=Streptomyces sp. SID3343 TaxID=2690260 RepID=UPI00136B7DAE|nr:hypothetical protein [Streptomyces sp. SID3343]MYW00562.1 hypothetical protein [Streptomyces sp. SID3343]
MRELLVLRAASAATDDGPGGRPAPAARIGAAEAYEFVRQAHPTEHGHHGHTRAAGP